MSHVQDKSCDIIIRHIELKTWDIFDEKLNNVWQ